MCIDIYIYIYFRGLCMERNVYNMIKRFKNNAK